jgi:hypothetical protein|tara:strand:+ start:712 stop:942 length:231 start_codon:yes stop_codon:yes gene_type:complete
MKTPYQTDEYRKWDRERSKERNKDLKVIAVKLNEKAQKEFKIKCIENDLTMNGAAKLLIKNWMNGSISININVKDK